MTKKPRRRPFVMLNRLPLLAVLFFPCITSAASEPEAAVVQNAVSSGHTASVLADAFEQSAQLWRRDAIAYARLPSRDEIGRMLTTYGLDEAGKPVPVSQQEIDQESVVVRDMQPLVGAVYHEYLMTKTAWFEEYGMMPDTLSFHSYQSLRQVNVLTVDAQLLSALGSLDGKTVEIKTSDFPALSHDNQETEADFPTVTLMLGDRVTDAGEVIATDTLQQRYSLQGDLPKT
ncbi:hypothetical protein [Photobacterium halotolerans]|uniref:Uncharacterized protein n=1 Tax=Photobacterium halotolerans TaxID=265726 RepID=A0A0F5V9A7_9GAMM|nr:hypothetical protein [Photobacterium halotolerans]KKC98760.1 hypothetical protein KY46_16695 [Photobacterium halotolerans]